MYNGSFIEDEINGYGQLYFKEKLVYRGEFKNGKAQGEGCAAQS